MRYLASRVLLSPREHRTEVMLSVGEMSVHRLRISPQEMPKTVCSLIIILTICLNLDI